MLLVQTTALEQTHNFSLAVLLYFFIYHHCAKPQASDVDVYHRPGVSDVAVCREIRSVSLLNECAHAAFHKSRLLMGTRAVCVWFRVARFHSPPPPTRAHKSAINIPFCKHASGFSNQELNKANFGKGATPQQRCGRGGALRGGSRRAGVHDEAKDLCSTSANPSELWVIECM